MAGTRTQPRDPLTPGRKAASEPRSRTRTGVRRRELSAWLTPKRQKLLRATGFSISLEKSGDKIPVVCRRCAEEFLVPAGDLANAGAFIAVVRDLRRLARAHDCTVPAVPLPKASPLKAVLGGRFLVKLYTDDEAVGVQVRVVCRRCKEDWWLPRESLDNPRPFRGVRDHRCQRPAASEAA